MGTFSQKRTSLIIRQILGAVSYMHNKGIVHRKIDPCHIFVENNSDSLNFLVKLDGLEEAIVRASED